MLKNLLQVIFGFMDSRKKKLFTDYMLTHQIIKTNNECGEDVYIAIEKQHDSNLDILVTKCKRLLSFVESHGLEQKYTPLLIQFGNEIENHVQTKMNIDHLFSKFEKIKKKIKGNSMSNFNLSESE
tara:strand:- start:4389 stop:4766 length:378 start_codon:yes stop_codon:yes gene_type:complete